MPLALLKGSCGLEEIDAAGGLQKMKSREVWRWWVLGDLVQNSYGFQCFVVFADLFKREKHVLRDLLKAFV